MLTFPPHLSSSRKWKTSVLTCYNKCETEFCGLEISTSSSLCLWIGKKTKYFKNQLLSS